jgi:hypothetical protein
MGPWFCIAFLPLTHHGQGRPHAKGTAQYVVSIPAPANTQAQPRRTLSPLLQVRLVLMDTVLKHLEERPLSRLASVCALLGLLLAATSAPMAQAHPDQQQTGQHTQQHEHNNEHNGAH